MLISAVLIAWILYEFTIFSARMLLQPILIGVGALMVLIPLPLRLKAQLRVKRRTLHYELRRALAVVVAALLRESDEVEELAAKVRGQLQKLALLP